MNFSRFKGQNVKRTVFMVFRHNAQGELWMFSPRAGKQGQVMLTLQASQHICVNQHLEHSCLSKKWQGSVNDYGLRTQILITQSCLISRVGDHQEGSGTKEGQQLNGWQQSWPRELRMQQDLWASLLTFLPGFCSDSLFSAIFANVSPVSTFCFGIFFLVSQIFSLLDCQIITIWREIKVYKMQLYLMKTHGFHVHRAVLYGIRLSDSIYTCGWEEGSLWMSLFVNSSLRSFSLSSQALVSITVVKTK